MNQQSKDLNLESLNGEKNGQDKDPSKITPEKKRFVEPTISTPVNVMEVTTFFVDILPTA
jgi:hypothetical protein